MNETYGEETKPAPVTHLCVDCAHVGDGATLYPHATLCYDPAVATRNYINGAFDRKSCSTRNCDGLCTGWKSKP